MPWLRKIGRHLPPGRGTGNGKRSGAACSKIQQEEGATLVEMAVALTVLIAVLFGIIEMCLALYTYHYISDAAREGTRYAIVRGANCSALTNCNATATQIGNYVKNLGYPGINTANMTVNTTWWTPSSTQPTTWSSCTSGTCNSPGYAVQVSVTYAFPLSIPYWKATTLTVSSTSQMVISN